MKRLIPLALIAAALVLPAATSADFDLASLNAQVQRHETRITTLEAAQPAPAPAQAPVATEPSPTSSSTPDSIPGGAPVPTPPTPTPPAPATPHIVETNNYCTINPDGHTFTSWRVDTYSDGTNVRTANSSCISN